MFDDLDPFSEVVIGLTIIILGGCVIGFCNCFFH